MAYPSDPGIFLGIHEDNTVIPASTVDSCMADRWCVTAASLNACTVYNCTETCDTQEPFISEPRRRGPSEAMRCEAPTRAPCFSTAATAGVREID